ncbi:MAG: hypothetical protein ACI4LP_03075 [Anaerovoracaceae bacterium]
MNEPKKLFNRIIELSGCEDKVALLQEIGRILLTEYVIKVEDVIVEPIWIEAYYYDDSNGFKDPFVHRNSRQKEENVLYFHHKTDDQRNGVDICLSPENKEFYLSFLLKYTLVDGVLRSQSRLSPLIRKKYKEGNHVLVHCDRPEGIIACTKRIGLKTNDRDPLKAEKEKYQNLELAIVRDFDKDFDAKIKLPRRKSLMNNYLLHTGCLDD